MISAVTYALSLALFAICVCCYWYSKDKRKLNLPPGPRPWPLIGNMLDIVGKDLHVALSDLGRRFGPIVWIRLGMEKVLVINNMDAISEAFARQAKIYSGRPAKRKTIDIMLGHGFDIVMSEAGERLKFYRHIVHSYLASRQTTRREKLFSVLKYEANSLVSAFGEHCASGNPLDPKLHVSRVVANVLCQTILGNRFANVNAELIDQLTIIQDIVDSLESFNVVDMIPSLEHLPIPSLRRFKKSLARKDNWLYKIIAEHKESMGDNDRDLLDILLRHQRNAYNSQDEVKIEMLSEITIGHIVYELFGGGIESSALVVLWCIVYMVHNPEWQHKVAKEVTEVSAKQGGIFPDDKSLYPLLDSCIKETMRLSTILPVGFPHRTVANSKLGGYDIPKDTMVITNLWAVHHDPQLWKDPLTFNPERFMENGKSVHRRGYLPFGMGSRVCLGSTLAKMEAFMFISHILANFEIGVFGNTLPDTRGPAGLTHRTRPFNIALKPRANVA